MNFGWNQIPMNKTMLLQQNQGFFVFQSIIFKIRFIRIELSINLEWYGLKLNFWELFKVIGVLKDMGS